MKRIAARERGYNLAKAAAESLKILISCLKSIAFWTYLGIVLYRANDTQIINELLESRAGEKP